MTTVNTDSRKTHRRESKIGILLAFATAAVFLIAILLSGEIGGYVEKGLYLAVGKVIPAAFPFMIICDATLAYIRLDKIPLVGKVFGWLFGVPKEGVLPLLLGNICGFPLGGKLTAEMYASGGFEKSAAERLLAYSSNPSAAFIITAVGGGIFGNVRVGIMLFLCVHISTLLTAQLFRKTPKETNKSINNIEQKFNFVSSVRSAGSASVGIASFIIIFACLVGICEKHLPLTWLRGAVISLLEVTSAVNFFAENMGINPSLFIAFAGFSLGFGGLSVMAQTKAFTEYSGLSLRNYFIIKIVDGIICFLLSYAGAILLSYLGIL